MARPRNVIKPGRFRRRGFTMTEMLIAASTTALVAAAAATLTSAVANAATETRGVRSTRSAGQYAIKRVGQSIRQARGIGQVTGTTVTLWLEDANNDDTLNLYEAGIIRYDAVNKQVVFEYLESSGATPTTTLSAANFKDASALTTLMTNSDKKSVVWAEDVASLTFTGYPNYTETRIVEAAFTIGVDDDAMDFRVSASPRATADYLFATDASSPPPTGSTRKARKKVSKWNGIQASEITAMEL